jgi:uncharacterized coiled-coil DUF342 family protein
MSELRDLLQTVDEQGEKITTLESQTKQLNEKNLELKNEVAALREQLSAAFAAIGHPLDKLLRAADPANHPHSVKIPLLPMVKR